MATQTKHRLGDILISKGLITPEQLNIAIGEQKKRRQEFDSLDPAALASVAPLGEVLIELGFIDHMQLKRGLGWQSVVRKMTLAMSLCAPLLTISYEATAATAVPIVSSSSSSKNSSSSLPLTIQAENYTSMVGVQTEATTDTDGGLNVGYIDANDSMTYSSAVNIPVTGSYKIVYRVASTATGGSFTLSEGSTVYDTVSVPNTGAYQKWVDVERTVTLTAGVHTLTIKATVGGFNINWFKIDNAGAALPQTIEAENYSAMTGIQTETTSDVGGGLNVGYIDANDTLSYASNAINIPTTGSYQISYRVASGTGGGRFSLNEVGGTTAYDTVTVPGTGSWQTWTTITRTVTLTAGTHTFGITSITGGFNINWFKIEKIAGSSSSSVASSTTTTSSSSKATAAVSNSSASTIPVTPSSSATSKISSSASSVPAVSSSSAKSTTAVSSSSSSVVSSSVSTSSAAAANALPFTIKADSFSAMSGIQTETTADTGGGMSVGYIDANDWLDFSKSSVNIPKTGTYKISYRVASESGGGSFTLNEAGKGAVYDTVSVPSTGAWQTWTTVERTVTLSAGVHNFGVTAINSGFNINWFKIEQISTPLPLTIEAESFSTMSGIQTETTTDTGGGLNVGYIDVNDWLTYSDSVVTVATTGTYTVTYRIASSSGGGSFTLNDVGVSAPLDTVSVPSTGAWQNWIDVKHNITLTAGTHTFKIVALTSGFNLNWFKIDKADSSIATGGGVTISSVSSSSTPAISTINSSSKAATISSSTASFSSSPTSSPSTTSVNGVVTSQVAGPVNMSWTAPNLRQNGSVLDITEIAGYEIRYKLASDENYTYISINDAWTNTYNFPWLEGSYVFQIAAFDKDGLYSDFVDVVSK